MVTVIGGVRASPQTHSGADEFGGPYRRDLSYLLSVMGFPLWVPQDEQDKLSVVESPPELSIGRAQWEGLMSSNFHLHPYTPAPQPLTTHASGQQWKLSQKRFSVATARGLLFMVLLRVYTSPWNSPPTGQQTPLTDPQTPMSMTTAGQGFAIMPTPVQTLIPGKLSRCSAYMLTDGVSLDQSLPQKN